VHRPVLVSCPERRGEGRAKIESGRANKRLALLRREVEEKGPKAKVVA